MSRLSCHSDPAAAGRRISDSRLCRSVNGQPEMFRFGANEHGWPMRVVEHRPAACVPSPENIRDSPLPANQRVTNPLGAQTGSLCSAYTGLPPHEPDVHPLTKNHARHVGKPQHDNRVPRFFS